MTYRPSFQSNCKVKSYPAPMMRFPKTLKVEYEANTCKFTIHFNQNYLSQKKSFSNGKNHPKVFLKTFHNFQGVDFATFPQQCPVNCKTDDINHNKGEDVDGIAINVRNWFFKMPNFEPDVA